MKILSWLLALLLLVIILLSGSLSFTLRVVYQTIMAVIRSQWLNLSA